MPRRRPFRAVPVLLSIALIALATASTSPARTAQPVPAGLHRVTVTLITGDVVDLTTSADGRQTVALEPGPDGRVPAAAITRAHGHLYVTPASALPLLAAGRLDQRLFDVTGLIAQRYDDAHSTTLPVIVDYGHGLVAAVRARGTTLPHAATTVRIPALGMTAYAADKHRARAFWNAVTDGSRLADGAARIDLDGRVHSLVDPNVEQIHAPEAWAAGYDGTGTTVAVLDTGYDPTHPDLRGVVADTANFSTNATVDDGNGHGTHVASTIAGTGAASGGEHGGVAPGTKLLIGKVLDDTGTGEDSQVLAGMQWAVAHHADVISMSLGGDGPGEDSDPLSQAVDELSESSKSLFVIAAGNNGADPGTITSPGAAADALTVGAVDSTDAMAYFSSRGPRTGDAGLKPDVTAPGVDIVAARAAGTSLGAPVDQYYTMLSGTSMATPHVAGEAAILKQEHPDWDGAELKDAIVESTDRIADATPFDTGTGRIDVEAALHETVLATPSVSLGWFPWPHSGDLPESQPVTYTNTGGSPITLKLAVTPAPGVTLSATRLRVPAGGHASADLTFDPAAAGIGEVSGLLTARPAGGGEPVRTAFGADLESEHYDLTVTVKPRPGSQNETHQVSIVGLANGDFEQRALAGDGPQTTTFRLPPGAYSVSSLSFGDGSDDASEGVLSFDQSVDVAAHTAVTLNESHTKLFTYDVQRPVLRDGVNLTIDSNAPAGFSGFTITGSMDRLYAQPLPAPADGTVDGRINWLLTQPDAVLTGRGTPLALRIVPSGSTPAWAAPVPPIAGRFRVVDAGSSTAPRRSGLRGAVALLSGDCTSLDAAAATLQAAGARAVIVYPGPGSTCVGTLAGPSPVPVFEARPAAAADLLTNGSFRAQLTTVRTPSYIYDLADNWPDRVPAGSVTDGHANDLARLVEHYDSMGGTTANGLHAMEMLIGWAPGRDDAAYGMSRPVAVPSTVTHLVSPASQWERSVDVITEQGASVANLWTPRIAVTAGERRPDTWFGGPIGSSDSSYLSALGDDAVPHRDGNTIYMYMPQWTDAAGHTGSAMFLNEFSGKVYQDGRLVMTGDDPLWLWGDFPSGNHQYRLVYETHRKTAFWQRSTHTLTSWTFGSRKPASGIVVLPLLIVDYDLPLSNLQTAPSGSYAFNVGVRMPPDADARRITSLRVELSWDHGGSWATLTPDRCASAGQCSYQVQNPRSGWATLRVTAHDAAGRSVRQTIANAYTVRGI